MNSMTGHPEVTTEQLDGFAEAAFLTDTAGVVVAWNRAAVTLLGHTAEVAVGSRCATMLEGVGAGGRAVCSHPCPMVTDLVPTRRAEREAATSTGGAPYPLAWHRGSGAHPDMSARRADEGRSSLVVVAVPVLLDGAPVLLHLLRDAPVAERDPLTQALSRDGFTVRGLDAQKRVRASGDHIALALVDLDGLKAINDAFGHDEGDRALIAVADALRDGRRSHVVARWGGDEFAMLMPATTAVEAAETLRRTLEAVRSTVRAGGTPVTFSAGVIELDWDTPLRRLIAEADAVLYRAKRTGRARVLAGRLTKRSRGTHQPVVGVPGAVAR